MWFCSCANQSRYHLSDTDNPMMSSQVRSLLSLSRVTGSSVLSVRSGHRCGDMLNAPAQPPHCSLYRPAKSNSSRLVGFYSPSDVPPPTAFHKKSQHFPFLCPRWTNICTQDLVKIRLPWNSGENRMSHEQQTCRVGHEVKGSCLPNHHKSTSLLSFNYLASDDNIKLCFGC